MNAVIKTGGKQYYVTEGSLIYVEKLNGEAGDVVTFVSKIENIEYIIEKLTSNHEDRTRDRLCDS